jgi:hypothetical protein
MTQVMFVGGPRHGKFVEAAPADERERYRVPALNSKDPQVEYLSTKLILTFPDPLTGEPTGETWHTWCYVLPGLYPDNPQATNALQQAVADAAMRFYVYTSGERTRGGPAAVAASAEPVYVAWCETCRAVPRSADMDLGAGAWLEEEEFVDQRSRAVRMIEHTQLTGHRPTWENRKA